jgi:N-methylhydantoinase A/oxoprolinase/acetone carboxylase beta subunit
MILGIDVGGTHTDAVLIDHGGIKRKAKVSTDAKNLVHSLLNVTSVLLGDENPEKLERVVLSTTISTNAIVQRKTDRVGMVLASGPGVHPSQLTLEKDVHFISGYVNHRGMEVSKVNEAEVMQIKKYFKADGIENVGIVGKFSTRNPRQELQIRDFLKDDLTQISLGHRMSGHLNFPRRIATTYLNAAVSKLYGRFVQEVLTFVRHQGISVPIYILKADGGTFDITQSLEFPVQTILSGPAASIMGILAMSRCREDAIALDIGGTTTDIAIFADGVPLLEAFGVRIDEHKTLIRGLRTKSIGLGGDSCVRFDNEKLTIGPDREGPAAAFGGQCPTPTDAMIVLGLTRIGDREKAVAAITQIAEKMHSPIEEAAKRIFDQACQTIVLQIKRVIEEINNQPVYTIHEMLDGKKLKPKTLHVVGGPAEPMAPYLGQLLNCPVFIPEHAEVANAIGAALARTTAELTILADTEQKMLTIAEDGYQTAIPSHFGREDAIRIGREKLREKAIKMGAAEEDIEMEVIENQEFNMIKQFYTTGKNIRVKLQVKPGLISGFKAGAFR